MSDANITLLDNLPEESDISTCSSSSSLSLDKESLYEIINDLSEEINRRVKAIDIYYSQFGMEWCTEVINKLSTIFQFSGTKIMEQYLYEICMKCDIPLILKITAVTSLCSNNKGYDSLDYICKNMNMIKGSKNEVPTPVQVSTICLLMTNDEYKNNAIDYFCSIINNERLECDFRYKTILSLDNKNITDVWVVIREASFKFMLNTMNKTQYRILAGQLLLHMEKKMKLTVKQRNTIENTLISFAQDTEVEYNLRADSCDVILRIGYDKNKAIARDIIMMLGRHEGKIPTIFNNAQNVHIDEIEESVIEILEYLESMEIKTISGKPGTEAINYEYVKGQIDDILEKEEPKKTSSGNSREEKKYKDRIDKIYISLNRIYMDRALYSKYNCTLLHILVKIWSYLIDHDSCEEMKKRLLEELVDMSGTCSSGFASRLVNVLSGFGTFNIRISFRDQIIANFTGRLNARARDIINFDNIEKNMILYDIKTKSGLIAFHENVISEMSINSNEYSCRPNFLLFFRKNMLSIREELYDEFKQYITDTDFDLYSRSAISCYESGGYI